MAYCPNCSDTLPALDATGCANCQADFTAVNGWRPTERPRGQYQEFLGRNPAAATETEVLRGAEEAHPMHPWLDLFLRLFVVIFMTVFFVGLHLRMPDRGMIFLILLVTCSPVFAYLLLDPIRRISKAARRDNGK